MELLTEYAPWLVVVYIAFMAYNCLTHIRNQQKKYNDQTKSTRK